MDTYAIDVKINNLEKSLNIVDSELKRAQKISKIAFSGNDNWREKASASKKIPLLEQYIKKIQLELSNLKLNRNEIIEEIKRQELVKIQIQIQKQEEEEKKQNMVIQQGPIAILEVE